jgi:hypothetical protein
VSAIFFSSFVFGLEMALPKAKSLFEEGSEPLAVDLFL